MVASYPTPGQLALVMNAARVSEALKAKQRVPVTHVVAGREAVGRIIHLKDESGSNWDQATLTDYNEETGEHKLEFESEQECENSDSDGSDAGERECWVCLGRRLFRWGSSLSADCAPNPTYKDFPGDHAAIGWKVRVYWNEMGRWYIGHVRSYDPRTGMHEVKFCDGDVRYYLIQNEAVLWLERSNGRKRGRQSSGTDSARKSAKSAKRANGVVANGNGNGNENGSSTSAGERRDSDERVRTAAEFHRQISEPANVVVARNDAQAPGSNGDGGRKKATGNGVTKDEQLELEIGPWHLRPRRGASLNSSQPNSKNPKRNILKTRIGIYWEGDDRFYRGTVTGFNESSGSYNVCYDDGTKEEVHLQREKFVWYGPRGRSTGYNPAMRDTMRDLGASGLPTDSIPTPSPPDSQTEEGQRPDPQDVIGKRVFVYWAADGQYYEGEVLAYCKRRKVHFVWYRDGEVEWLDLAKEHLIWGGMMRGCGFPAGLAQDEEPPRGRSAVGWRIAVFWKDDAMFYEGKITGYNNATGRHDILYDDNETENLSLSSEKVIWRLPPNVGTGTDSATTKRASLKKKTTKTARKTRSDAKVERDTEDGVSGQTLNCSTDPVQRSKSQRGRGRGRRTSTGRVAASVSRSQPPPKRSKPAQQSQDEEVTGPAQTPALPKPASKGTTVKAENEEIEANGQNCGKRGGEAGQDGVVDSPEASSRCKKPKGRPEGESGEGKKGQDVGGGVAVPKSRQVGSGHVGDERVVCGNEKNTGESMGVEQAGNGAGGKAGVDVEGDRRDDVNKGVGNEDGGGQCNDISGEVEADGQVSRDGSTALRVNTSVRGNDAEMCSDLSSPRSPGHMSVDGEDHEMDKMAHFRNMDLEELPCVDVTRLVRLPPEFGSLEVKLRIKAGSSGDAGEKSDEVGTSCESGKEHMLVDRVEAIDKMLSVIGRYEKAYHTIGRLPSRCDESAMREVLPDALDSCARRMDPLLFKKPSVNKKSTAVKAPLVRESSGRLYKKGGNKVGRPRKSTLGGTSSMDLTKGEGEKRLKMGSVNFSASEMGLGTGLLRSGSGVVTVPPQTSQSGLVTQISPRATSQFGVSSVPAIVPSSYNTTTNFGTSIAPRTKDMSVARSLLSTDGVLKGSGLLGQDSLDVGLELDSPGLFVSDVGNSTNLEDVDKLLSGGIRNCIDSLDDLPDLGVELDDSSAEAAGLDTRTGMRKK